MENIVFNFLSSDKIRWGDVLIAQGSDKRMFVTNVKDGKVVTTITVLVLSRYKFFRWFQVKRLYIKRQIKKAFP